MAPISLAWADSWELPCRRETIPEQSLMAVFAIPRICERSGSPFSHSAKFLRPQLDIIASPAQIFGGPPTPFRFRRLISFRPIPRPYLLFGGQFRQKFFH